MSISYHPKVGQILMCDFSRGFKPPEMIKKRPVVVLAVPTRKQNVVTVVALSSTPPNPKENFHFFIDKKYLPKINFFMRTSGSWCKGNMIYSVAFHRLDLIKIDKDINGKRIYFTQCLGRDAMQEIYSCVLCALNLGNLKNYL